MEPRSKRKHPVSRGVYLAFSVVVTACIFGYLLTRVSLSEVVDLVRKADMRGILMFLVLSLSMSVFRTWRYDLVLRTSGHVTARFPLFLVVLVRNFFSDLLPARVGTLVYVYIVTTRLGIPFGAAASSFALAFLFDMIALAPLIAVAAVSVGAVAGMSPPVLISAGLVLVIIVVVILVLLPRLVHTGVRVVGRVNLAGKERLARWRTVLTGALAEAERELVRAREAGIYSRLLVLSLLVRVTKYGSLYVFLFALLAQLGYGFDQLSIPGVFLGLCSAEMAASLPISGIAGFGAYEGAWALTFRVLGFPEHIADLTAVAHHLFTQVYGYSLGALALLVLLIPVFSQRRPADGDARHRISAPLFYARVAVLVLVVAGLLCLAYQWPVVPAS